LLLETKRRAMIVADWEVRAQPGTFTSAGCAPPI
jgi:hypothetical protein